MATLSIDGLHIGYGARRVLDGITLPLIEGGTVVGVLGPNGVGKSTLLRALAGLMPYSGDVHLNGQRLDRMAHPDRARLVGYLPQTLPQGTTLVAYEAVVSACRAVRPDLRDDEVEAAVEAAFDRLGLRHLAFEALGKLSGGQRQMVGLAQVLVRRPPILLLDEPTSALDLRWQMGVLEVVREVAERRNGICLMALHDINLAMRHCDTIVLLSDRGVLSHGAPDVAMTIESVRRAYGVDGRIEQCTRGKPYLIPDSVSMQGLG